MIFYTYLWLREDGTPYYVGKGHGTRAYVWHRRIGHAPPQECILTQEFPSEENCFEAEKFLIQFYGRKDLGTGALANRSDGGIGGDTLTLEERQQRSLLYKQRGVVPPSRLGTHHKKSQHTKDAISASKKGKTNGRVGYKHTEATLQKMRDTYRRKHGRAEFGAL